MTACAISPQQAIERVERSLHLPASGTSTELSVAFVGQAIRRAVNILAPCARHELERGVRHSLWGFGVQPDRVDDLVESTLEALIVYGDILEIRVNSHDDWGISKFVLRPAAPFFVQRKDGVIVILGVAGDVITPLTEELTARLLYRESLRVLMPMQGEALALSLRDLGLIELDENSWLRIPSKETYKDHATAWIKRLKGEPVSADIEGLVICDAVRSSRFYPDRWVQPGTNYTGPYVARRPQRYGSNLWCLAELQAGKVVRFLDLFAPGDRNRACDIAWRIQMALDSSSGRPQTYQRRRGAGHDVFDFFSPIPSWAERRLALSGRRLKGERCLFSYEIPSSAVEAEGAFLRDTLWLTPSATPS